MQWLCKMMFEDSLNCFQNLVCISGFCFCDIHFFWRRLYDQRRISAKVSINKNVPITCSNKQVRTKLASTCTQFLIDGTKKFKLWMALFGSRERNHIGLCLYLLICHVFSPFFSWSELDLSVRITSNYTTIIVCPVVDSIPLAERNARKCNHFLIRKEDLDKHYSFLEQFDVDVV